MHGDSVPFDCSAKEMRQRECSNGAGGAQIASGSNKNSSLKFSLCVNLVCKNFDATFWVSTKRHPDAIDQMIRMPKKSASAKSRSLNLS